MKKFKKPLIILGIVLGAILVLAVILGILNATVGGGEWNLGWTDYNYDDTGYEVGSGSVFATGIETIDLDWIDGSVEIVTCQDAFISLTEGSSLQLTEDSLLRWCVSEDGKTLTVKYRKPSWFFGDTQNKQKYLILRVPEGMLENMDAIKIKTVSASVALNGIRAQSLTVENRLGDTKLSNCTCVDLSLDSTAGELSFAGEVSGNASLVTRGADVLLRTSVTPRALTVATVRDVELYLPRDAVLSLEWEKDHDHTPMSDFPYRKEGERYLIGEGDTRTAVTVIDADRLLVSY